MAIYMMREPTLPTEWLLWYWKLQEDADDYSWNWKNWTWTWTGSYYEVSGKTWAVISSSAYITTSLSYASVPITICVWEYLNTTTSNTYPIIDNSKSSSASLFSLIRYPWSSLVRWLCGGGVVTLDYAYSGKQQRDFWALSIDSSWNTKLYLNWDLVKAWTWWANATATAAWKIGNWYTNSSSTLYKYIWYIRHAAIYNKVLSADEIQTFYTLTSS